MTGVQTCALPIWKSVLLACGAGAQGLVVAADVAVNRARLVAGSALRMDHPVRVVVADAVMVERSNECIVVDARGAMRYRGAIDDQHGYDASLPEPRHHWLADAIDTILADPSKRVEPRGTPVAGCLLTKKKPEQKPWLFS